MANKRELRYIPFEFEVREDGQQPHLKGYAAVFNQEAVIYGLWREMAATGSFKKTIQESDIRALWNHNADLVLGRNKAATLSLSEDDHGLKVDITPPDTQAGRDAVTSIKRGDVSQMSIAFDVMKEEWANAKDRTELPLRTIREYRLYEVSPVTFPAFEQTEISARSGLYLPDGEIDPLEEARRLLRCAERGMTLTDQQRATLRAAMELYRPYVLEPEPDALSGHHSERGTEPELSHWEPQPDSHYSAEERERRLTELSESIYPRR